MSDLSRPFQPTRRTGSATARLARLCSRVALWWAARRQRALRRHELHSLDEHTLRDIGLSHRTAAEWPWVQADF